MKRIVLTLALLGSIAPMAYAQEASYYSTSHNPKDFYFIDPASVEDVELVEGTYKKFELLWVLKPDAHPPLSWAHLGMVADCGKPGEVAISRSEGFNQEGKLIQSERANPNLALDWFTGPDETHYYYAWKAACTPGGWWNQTKKFDKASDKEVVEWVHEYQLKRAEKKL